MAKTEVVVTPIADVLGVKALEYLNLFEQAVTSYTPQAADTALLVVQINGAQNLFIGAVCTGISLAALFEAKKQQKFAREIISERGERWVADQEQGAIATAVALALVGGVAAIPAAVLFNFWNWVAVFEPKLWLAYKLFEKVIN